MNKRQSNYVTMTKATLAFMENKRAEWETIIPVSDSVAKVKEHVNTAEAENKIREGMKTTGLTQDKDQVFETMCNVAYKITAKLKAYAKASENHELLASVNFTQTSLQAGSQEAVLLRCETIYGIAVKYADKLVNYQVTAEKIAELETAINNYKPLTSVRDAVGDERVAKTAKISTVIGLIRSQLDILDDLVEGFFDEEFIDAYNSARQIIDR